MNKKSNVEYLPPMPLVFAGRVDRYASEVGGIVPEGDDTLRLEELRDTLYKKYPHAKKLAASEKLHKEILTIVDNSGGAISYPEAVSKALEDKPGVYKEWIEGMRRYKR